MITVTRTHQISMGHRVYQHEGKCKNLHGHNYTFEMTLRSRSDQLIERLDELGRVIDFSAIKRILGNWLEEKWDHKMLLWKDDPLLYGLRQVNSDNDPKSVVSLPYNPTVENIAKYFAEDIAPGLLLKIGVDLVTLVVWETDKCCATWTYDEEADESNAARTR